jgi:hypothetical protein
MNRACLRCRVAKLEGAAQAVVTVEELLDRVNRGGAPDDPDFDRRLAASPIGRCLTDLSTRLDDQ